MSKLCSIFKKLLLVGMSFFAVTFTVYYFNLDMKMTSAMEPLLEFFYNRVDRDQHI